MKKSHLFQTLWNDFVAQMSESAFQEEPKPAQENGKEDKENKPEETEVKEPTKSSQGVPGSSALDTSSNVAEIEADEIKSQE